MTPRQWWCRLRRGHDQVLAFAGRRMFMRCTSCAHESPGVVTGGRGPRVRYQGDPRRHVLVPLRLATKARRSA